MKLRTNKVLRFLAVMVFSLGSLAPAIFSEQSAFGKGADFSSYQNGLSSHSLALSVFTEESDSEERDDIISREITLFIDYTFVATFLKYAYTDSLYSFLTSQEEHPTTRTPLFQLHCTYVI